MARKHNIEIFENFRWYTKKGTRIGYFIERQFKSITFNTFSRGRFLKRVSTKSHGSSTTTTNAEVMSIQTDIGDVIEHVQCQLCMCWVTKKGYESWQFCNQNRIRVIRHLLLIYDEVAMVNQRLYAFSSTTMCDESYGNKRNILGIIVPTTTGEEVTMVRNVGQCMCFT